MTQPEIRAKSGCFDNSDGLEKNWRIRRPTFLPGVFSAESLAQYDPEWLTGLCHEYMYAHYYTQSRRADGTTNGKRVPLLELPLGRSRFDAGRAAGDLPTLFYYGLHFADPSVSELRDALQIGQSSRQSSNAATLSVPGSGVGYHSDIIDVILVQTRGRRRWHIYSELPVDDSMRNALCRGIYPDRKEPWDAPEGARPILEVDLSPGDILYIPALFPHDGRTLGDADDEASVSLTFGWRAITPYMYMMYLAKIVPGMSVEDIRTIADMHPAIFYRTVPDFPETGNRLHDILVFIDTCFAQLDDLDLKGEALQVKQRLVRSLPVSALP